MENLRLVLQNELFERCRKNPAYSLRAFAQNLGIPSSSLSAIMSGTRKASRKNIQKIAAHLDMPQLNIIDSVKFHAKGHQWQDVESDVFMAISQWYHFAILELIKVLKGRISPAVVSKKLSIKATDARAAMERLERLGLISMTDKGLYLDTNKGFASYYDGYNTSDANRALMAKLLDIAKDKLQTVPIEQRDHSSTTMSLNKKQMKKAKEMLKAFRRSFTEEMEKTSSPDAVYELSISFFPLTKED